MIWRIFPSLYAAPFIFATTQFAILASLSEVLRWVFLAIACMYGLRFRFRRGGCTKTISTNVDLFLLISLIVFFVSSLWSIDLSYSLQRSVSVALLLGASFWAFWRYADQFSEKILLDRVLMTIVAVLAANLVLSWFLADPMLAGRFRGFFTNPNNVGIISVLAGGALLIRWWQHSSFWNTIALLVVLANLVLAGSRSAILGFLVVFILSVLRTTLTKPVHGILFLLVAGICGAMITQTDFFLERVLREETLADGSNRIFFWRLAEDYISHRWLLGHGFGTDIVIHEYYRVDLGNLGLRGAGVMSSYYGLAIQIGVPMSVMFFGLIWLYVGSQLVRNAGDFWIYSLSAILVAGLIQAAFEPVLISAGNAFSFLFLILFMLLVRRITYRKRRIQLSKDGKLI